MKKLKQNIATIGFWILIIIPFLILLSLIALEVYVLVTYGGKPITEVPSWALWFMFKGGH